MSLHKYLYANVDPVNIKDPSGNFGIASTMSAVSITANLASRASTVYTVFQIATGKEEFSATEIASNIILSRLPATMLKPFYKKLCGKNSFDGSTLVNTSSGLIPIENIEIGQLVLSFNEDNGEIEYSTVSHIITGVADYEFTSLNFGDDVIKATVGHPFYVGNRWLEARYLTTNMGFYSLHGQVDLQNRVDTREHKKVYNISVRNNHNYFVGSSGILVHNSKPYQCNIFNSAGEIVRSISISSKQLQRKWKHANSFGISGNYNKANADVFRKAIQSHIEDVGSFPIAGTYRGNDVIHFLNKSSGLNVIKDLNGNFVSGWKLNGEQLGNVLKRGAL